MLNPLKPSVEINQKITVICTESSFTFIFVQFFNNYLNSIKNFISAIFDIWKFCHQAGLVDRTSIALIFAAVLTSPDRQLVSRHKTQYLDNVINELHSGIVDSLRLHLSISNRSQNAFAKGNFLMGRKFLAIVSVKRWHRPKIFLWKPHKNYFRSTQNRKWSIYWCQSHFAR